MFICSELIEKLEDPRLFLACNGYFWPGSDKFESWNLSQKFDGVMT